MDWTHGVAFVLGVVFFTALAFFRKPKEVHTRRDFMASAALRSRIKQYPDDNPEDVARVAVRDADALLKVLDEKGAK